MACIAEQAKLRLRAQAGKPSSSSASSSSPTTAQTSFRPVAVQDLSKYSLDGEPLGTLALPALLEAAKRHRLPASTLEQEGTMRMLFAALLAASGGGGGRTLAFESLSDECAGLLLHAIRREGLVSAHTAEALNVLGKPQVVERYRSYGNKWTLPTEQPDPSELARARARLDPKSDAASMGEWLRTLSDALEAPVNARPWYRSKAVLAILALAALFVLVHALLLFKTLSKIHTMDSTLLLLPVAGLSASAMVALFAVVINKISG